MAKATRIKTRTPGVAKVGERFEWRSRRTGQQGMCVTYEEAKDAKARPDLSGPVSAEVRTVFGVHAREWIAGYRGRNGRGFGEASRQRYREGLEGYVIPYFDEVRARKFATVKRADVRAFVTWLENHEQRDGKALAPATINNSILAPLKAMYSDAIDDGDLPGPNPAQGIRANPRVAEINLDDDDNDKRAFTPDELGRVLAAAGDDLLLLTVLADTGVRWGEACELRGRDLKHGHAGAYLAVRRAWDAKTRKVGRPKSGKSRDIPISPELARSLWRLQRRPDDLLFTSPRGERLNYQNALRRMLVPILKAASAGEGATDLTWAGFHTFRHTFATLLIVVYGVNVKRVSKLLGHHAASYTLDVYTHLFDEDRGPTVSVSELLAEQRSGAGGGPQGARWLPATPQDQPNVVSPETPDLQAESQ
jgi:integrase